MALANLKLSSPGHFLTEGLEDCLTSIPSDLVIQCCDGKVFLHKVILAPRLVSQAFVKVLKAHFEDDLVHILIPDAFKSQVEHLVQLLYCGKTFTSVSEEDLEGLKTLAQLLKIGSLELTTMLKDADTEHAEVPELSIAYFDKKKPAKKTLPFEDLEESLSLRRSKRPKIRNKRLDDDAFAKEDFSGKVELTRPDQVGSSTEKTIASVKVEVTEPKEEALELQAPKSMLPAEVVRHCLICEKKLVGKFAFSKHLKSKHSQGWYKCKSCDAPFLSGFKLHEHARLKRHQDLEPKKYQKTTFQCGLCESTFATFNAFQSHSLSNHNIFPLECQICKKRYKEQATFKNHMETHQGVLKYECDVCAKRFVTRERLFAHRRLHLGKRFKCSQCEFKARSSTALRTHIQMKHLEPKYECVLCMKKFGSKQNLEQHEVVHTGLTPWHCNICDVRFKRQHHFKAHLNSNNHKTKNNEAVVEKSKKAPAIVDIIPEPEPQIECQVCRTSFKFDFHLKQHLRSKNHTSKVEEKLNRGEAVPDHLIVDKSDYVFDFANDDFLQHADQNELFLDDSNVQLIVINEANQDVMLMTHGDVKLSDAAPDQDNALMSMSLE